MQKAVEQIFELFVVKFLANFLNFKFVLALWDMFSRIPALTFDLASSHLMS